MPDELLGTVHGMASQVRKEIEGSIIVWRFRFDRGDGILRPIELRGDEIRGDLDSGDRVQLLVQENDVDATAIRLKSVFNLTTGFRVEALDKPNPEPQPEPQPQAEPRARRLAGFISQNVATAVISAVVTGGVSFLFAFVHVGASHARSTIGPQVLVPGERPLWRTYVLVAVLFDLVAFIIFYWQLRRQDKQRDIKRRLWPYPRSRHTLLAVAVGLLAGELAATLILWATHKAL
jgi:hypothetical protein